jgi:hypothetical protein
MNFLEELEQLRYKTPRLYNINIGSENSDYCTHSDKNKNCYLLFAANFNEDCLYGGIVLTSRDCTDCNNCEYSELCYECISIDHCYNCNFSQELKNSSDCFFCYDCIGCKNCFGSAGLRQKEFYFFNEQLNKEEYKKRIAEFMPLNKENTARATAELEQIKLKIPYKAAHLTQSENCTGEYVEKSKNCFSCFDAHESQDCCYLQDCWRTKDCVDMTFSDGSEMCYDSFSIGLNTYNCNFSDFIRTCSDCEYCELCFSCKHCFGCVGLQSKEFYILNKPYSRDEYFKKIEEIKTQMKTDGSYGKRLPTTYKYEDTAAVYWK